MKAIPNAKGTDNNSMYRTAFSNKAESPAPSRFPTKALMPGYSAATKANGRNWKAYVNL